MTDIPETVARLRELLVKAKLTGLSMPGEPAWPIEQERQKAVIAALQNYESYLPQLLDALPSQPEEGFAPCPTCHQYSHSIGTDALAAAFNHFQSRHAHPVRGHSMGDNFDETTRDAAQVLMAAARASQPREAELAEGELLPCPFCGGDARLEIDRDGTDRARVLCDMCETEGPAVELTACLTERDATDEAQELWNTRAASHVKPSGEADVEGGIEAACDAFMARIVVDGNGGLEFLEEAMIAALAAIPTPEPVREGWKLIPVVATPEMIEHLVSFRIYGKPRDVRAYARHTWSAMLAAYDKDSPQ